MSLAPSIAERVAFAALRLWALASILAGFSAIVAALPVAGMASASTLALDLALGFGAVFLVGGGVSLFIARSRPGLLASERTERDAASGTFGGWLAWLALTLLFVPVWLLSQLESFAAFWADLWPLLDRAGVWEAFRRPDASGLVLLPVMAVVALPGLEAVTVCGFVAASLLLILLMSVRSVRFPRGFLLSTILLATLVVANDSGARLVTRAGPVIERWVRESSATPAEQAPVLEWIDRYTAVTPATARTLAWALGPLLLWLPFIFRSERIPLTFGRLPAFDQEPAREPTGLLSPRPDAPPVAMTREEYFERAAAAVDGRGPTASDSTASLIVAGLLVFLVVFVIALIALFTFGGSLGIR